MTRILKPVTRVTLDAYSTLYPKPRPVAVSILPGDVLEFRELRRRQRWTLSIQTAFRYAVQCRANAELAEKRTRAAIKANITRRAV